MLLTSLIPLTLLTITPGVDTLLVIRNSHRGGWRDGVVSSFGICSGLFVHAFVSAVGISLILLQSALAFNTLKLIGAGYLIWLGATSLRSACHQHGDMSAAKTAASGFRFSRSFREGLLSNVLNPKTIVFYMAFLPQFIDPAASALQQSLLIAGLHFVIAMIYQSLLATLVGKAGRWLRAPAVRRTLDGLTGSIMLLFGFKLAFDR
ncbi:resistance to homoserine/threonine (RhtB) family protein [Malonomonas rubra DSM 5091]|uniref:Resistance to homoserine/threonine (RhtB) family protein n=1 Tax=Malonomonas rubra DSM 5091 TaxID=1122189 RepID=A0A1M6J8D7_MALRU|nr:LysE family translocator [Malonomonas rubra]SHJ42931.1 resistance to homoserine/threonine (RhtB) family protein [Malonomonas rubra DSM 5091]